MSILGKRENRRKRIGRGSDGISRVSLIGYFILTLVIIWSAALVPGMGELSSIGVWFPPLLLTLFYLVLAVVILRSGKERNF